MFKNKVVFGNKIDKMLKYVIFYSIFTFFIVFNVSNNFLLNLVPDFTLPMIFFAFIWPNNKKLLYPPINLLLLGLLIDTYNFLPLFVSSFTLLISYKIMSLIKKFLVSDNYMIYLLRDSTIFMFIFFTLRWFIISYYNENFYQFYGILLDILINIIYCVIFYSIFNKYLKNV